MAETNNNTVVGPDAKYMKMISADGFEFIIPKEEGMRAGTLASMMMGSWTIWKKMKRIASTSKKYIPGHYCKWQCTSGSKKDIQIAKKLSRNSHWNQRFLWIYWWLQTSWIAKFFRLCDEGIVTILQVNKSWKKKMKKCFLLLWNANLSAIKQLLPPARFLNGQRYWNGHLRQCFAYLGCYSS